MDGRISVVVNGKRDLSKVVSNLKKLFESDGKVLLYTFSGEAKVREVLSSALGKDECDIAANMTFAKFNAYAKLNITADTAKKFTVLAMPNSLFRKIPCAFNAALKFVDDTKVARFVHFFCDDLKFNDAEKYEPSRYEWYMDKFGCPFLCDPKTTKSNYAFKKLSPRFVLVSKRLPFPISFYHFEGNEHFVIDRDAMKENFDEKISRLYMTEFIMRLHAKGFVKHMTFYPDPFLETILLRDDGMPHAAITDEVRKQLADDDRYISVTLDEHVVPESAVDPIIKEHGSVIDALPYADAKENI